MTYILTTDIEFDDLETETFTDFADASEAYISAIANVYRSLAGEYGSFDKVATRSSDNLKVGGPGNDEPEVLTTIFNNGYNDFATVRLERA